MFRLFEILIMAKFKLFLKMAIYTIIAIPMILILALFSIFLDKEGL
jgi:hypothetical protein